MESPESIKPITPATIPKKARKKRKKKAVPAPKPKHLTIIKSSAERGDVEKGEKNQNGAAAESRCLRIEAGSSRSLSSFALRRFRPGSNLAGAAAVQGPGDLAGSVFSGFI